MNKLMVVCFMLCPFSHLVSQFSGTYSAQINGDKATLNLNQKGVNITGKMTDSQQTYDVSGTINANAFEGLAKEATLGITFILKGNLNNNTLFIDADMDLFGSPVDAFTANFIKVNGESNKTSSNIIPLQSHNFLQNKTIDSYVIGTWRQESHYNSGYGSDFSGSTYTYLTFNRDHTMSDGGSKATMSGSNYSGSSEGTGNNAIIQNVWYYTSNGALIAIINDNGKISETEMGKYYIENGKMLFTQANTGKKILYYKE